ncbi:MAG TPA: alpha/beta hydrolase [Anaerolineaceae bacterium]
MQSNWTQNDLKVNGVKIHYTRTGHGDKKPMVLIHGFSDHGLMWTPTARDLEAEYDVIMPDMRAHGLSERVQPGEKVDMAADVAELIRALGLKRPIVGGHSMGAGITYQIGVRFPELARALILEDGPFFLAQPDEPQPPSQPGENPIVKWAKSLPNQTTEELLAQYRKDHSNWSEELIQLMVQSKKQLDPNIVDTLSERIRQDRTAWLTTIQDIAVPMLVITANPKLGGLVTPEAAAKVRELNPRATVVTFSDVGHLIRFDKYDAFIAAVKAFLRQLPD